MNNFLRANISSKIRLTEIYNHKISIFSAKNASNFTAFMTVKLQKPIITTLKAATVSKSQ